MCTLGVRGVLLGSYINKATNADVFVPCETNSLQQHLVEPEDSSEFSGAASGFVVQVI